MASPTTSRQLIRTAQPSEKTTAVPILSPGARGLERKHGSTVLAVRAVEVAAGSRVGGLPDGPAVHGVDEVNNPNHQRGTKPDRVGMSPPPSSARLQDNKAKQTMPSCNARSPC